MPRLFRRNCSFVIRLCCFIAGLCASVLSITALNARIWSVPESCIHCAGSLIHSAALRRFLFFFSHRPKWSQNAMDHASKILSIFCQTIRSKEME